MRDNLNEGLLGTYPVTEVNLMNDWHEMKEPCLELTAL